MADFILYKPQNSGNIGMAVRALSNLQMPPLHIVSMMHWRETEARKLAANASDAVTRIVFHEHIAEIYADYHVLIGTTAKPRTGRTTLPMHQLGKLTLDAESDGKRVALLFGPEDIGLQNDITEKCDYLLTFTIQDTVPVLNLAQTILLCAYEIHLHQQIHTTLLEPKETMAQPQQIHQMIQDLERLLAKIEFNKSDRSRRAAHILFRLIRRIELKNYELSTLQGLIRQIHYVLDKKNNQI